MLLRCLIHFCLKGAQTEDIGELQKSPIKQAVGEETEPLIDSFHCLEANAKGQQPRQTGIRSCYKTSEGQNERLPSLKWGDK